MEKFDREEWMMKLIPALIVALVLPGCAKSTADECMEAARNLCLSRDRGLDLEFAEKIIEGAKKVPSREEAAAEAALARRKIQKIVDPDVRREQEMQVAESENQLGQYYDIVDEQHRRKSRFDRCVAERHYSCLAK